MGDKMKRIKISVDIIEQLFKEGSENHFKVIEGLKEDEQIVSIYFNEKSRQLEVLIDNTEIIDANIVAETINKGSD